MQNFPENNELDKLRENSQLKLYECELREDTNIDIHNIGDKSKMISQIRSKWLIYWKNEKENIRKIKQKKETIIQNLNKNTKSSILSLKSEDIASHNDIRIKKLNILMDNSKFNIEFIERALNIFQDMNYQIGNSIKLYEIMGKI
jgi:hypothetical protein